MGGAHILKLFCVGVENLDVGGDIPVTPFLGVRVEHLVRHLGHIQLVVTNRQYIVVNLVEDWHGHLAVLLGRVRQAGAVVQITCVDEKQVGAHVAGSLLHAAGESNKVTPVCTVVLLLDVTLEPTVRVGLELCQLGRGLLSFFNCSN